MAASADTEQRLLWLLGNVSDAIVYATVDGRVTSCNDSACRIFGYTREEFVQLTRRDLCALDDPRLAEAMRGRAQNGLYRGGLTLLRKGGERFEAELTSIEMETPEGPGLWLSISDVSDRERANAATTALKEGNELLQALSDAAFEAVIMHRNGVIVSANRAAEVFARVAPGGLNGAPLFDFVAPESHALVLSRIQAQDPRPYAAFGRRSDGTTYPLEAQVRTGPMQISGGPVRVVAVRDLTARRMLEDQIRHAQKLEAMGQLAGGVAHDFHNLLSVILGSVSLASSSLPADHLAQEALLDAVRATERAAELARQLLAFGRRRVVFPRVIDLNELLAGMESLLRRLLGPGVNIQLVPAPDLLRVKADTGQLEDVVINLAMNARDAMPQGGSLTVSTKNVDLDTAAAESMGLSAGPHVIVSVIDTGVGMDDETLARAFEPFFTTKGPGRASGLGLASVFGVVKQAGGHVWVQSTPGQGSAFHIALAATAEPVAPAPPAGPPGAVPRGQTILIADDEPQLRRVLALILRKVGYHVLEGGTPSEVEEQARLFDGKIDLLLSDVVMPELSGTELAERLVALRPDLRVLFMSGNPDFGRSADPATRSKVLAGSAGLLDKPIAPPALLAAIARALA